MVLRPIRAEFSELVDGASLHVDEGFVLGLNGAHRGDGGVGVIELGDIPFKRDDGVVSGFDLVLQETEC